MKIPKSFLIASALFAIPAHGAITAVSGGQNHPSLLQNQTDWTVDLGLVVPALPSGPGAVLFESGGDGTGIAAVIIGSDLVIYHDSGDFSVSTPAVDNKASYDISSFAGEVVSMRAVASLGTAADTIELSILGVSGGSFNQTFSIAQDITNAAGGNRFGFGGVAQDLAGLDESAEVGFPNMAAFNNAAFDVDLDPVGANVLGADVLQGMIYTGADAAPGSIPAPGSWGLTAVPEPSTGLLGLLGAGLVFFRRRR